MVFKTVFSGVDFEKLIFMMNFEKVAEAVRKDISKICKVYRDSFRNITTVGTGGEPLAVAEPMSEDELLKLLEYLNLQQIKWIILGNGSKVVAPDGKNEVVVIRSKISYIHIEDKGDIFEVVCGAGVELKDIVALGTKYGFDKVWALAGIPATVGGAVFMNAGTRAGEISDFVEKVFTVDLTLSKNERRPHFSYRSSDLHSEVITGVFFRFKKARPSQVRDKVLEYLTLRRKTQPVWAKNFGCIFKNPSPHLPAGKILDKLGLKGMKVGKVKISQIHANFVENEGESSSDVVELIRQIEDEVESRLGIKLEREVIVI